MLGAGCSEPQPPISVDRRDVTVLNQTDQDWKDVLIVVNDHFRGVVPVLKAEGRANAPLAQFTTGHGQRWTSGACVRDRGRHRQEPPTASGEVKLAGKRRE